MRQINLLRSSNEFCDLPNPKAKKSFNDFSISLLDNIKLLVFLVPLGIGVNSYSQEEWKPQTHLTGYVNTIAEYTDLQNRKEVINQKGIGLSDVAFLATYKPLQKLEFKGTFVYTHNVPDIQSLLVEANGTYTINEGFKLGAGKYLTPLSPVNQYFYAPLNPSATLPMLVSHHVMLPQSISGFQVSGEIGKDVKFGYNLTYGEYGTYAHSGQGIIGLVGREDISIYLMKETSTVPPSYNLGGSARIYGNYQDILNVGLNYMDYRRTIYDYQVIGAAGAVTAFTPAVGATYGIDMELKIGGLKVNGEYWKGYLKTTDIPEQIKTNTSSYYVEAIYETGIFSPYVRYDYVNEMFGSIYLAFPTTKLLEGFFPTTAYSVGVAVRPIYEVMLKLEYRYIDANIKYSNINIPAPLQTALPPTNPLNIAEQKYDHFILSLVYSF